MKTYSVVFLLVLAFSNTGFAGSKYVYKFKLTCRGAGANGKSGKTVLYDSAGYCGEITQENRFSKTSQTKLIAECKTKYAQVQASKYDDFKFQKELVSECPSVSR